VPGSRIPGAGVIKRLLIANRGEIAVRIIRACRELAIESVAVYSDADARAPHVLAADRAVAIGPAPARDSYLSIPRVIDAARQSRADAVHPGYGFLAENAAFAAACADAGLIFVGPPADVMARMGSKIEARRLVHAAGVPVVPGETPADQSDAGLLDAIRRVGLPALIKASAGGGGKGMRRAGDSADARDDIQAARREATAAFGDGTLYVERLVERPHHVEVQVFGDGRGRVVHLFERECSVQRRHQKVIEESPSPVLTPRLRDRITSAAVVAATAGRYLNAGTVEFLVDVSTGGGDAAPFYFLEMNTRLQVEHPVTEEVTGLDLVRAQLLVASGEPLPWSDEAIRQRGHAIEARIYAEDPSNDFLPQAGPLLLYREPRLPGVRVDTGVHEGGAVSIHYDPIMAKVIAVAETRPLAIAKLSAALRAFPILGVRTNVPFLVRVLEHPRFLDGHVDTGFLDREGAALTDTTEDMPAFVRDAAARADQVPGPEQSARHPQSTINPRQSTMRWDPWG
jgi:acetyl-CoA/propionyl-CoA carboxylase, biotin carboxylase, biotin carboxyl carrier protein